LIAPRPGQPQASAAIWRWQEPAHEAKAGAAPARIRALGSIQASVGAGMGLLSYLYWSQTLAFFIFGVAGIILISALVSPTGLYAAIQRMFEALGQALGRGLTFVLMSGLFYTFFLPFGKLFRRGRRDKMRRWFEADAATYWEARPQADASADSLERQY
jgi:hypothetical protein